MRVAAEHAGWLAWRSGSLAGFAGSHDNNFNLIRVIAALLVLYSHSFVIATGQKAGEPLAAWLGTTPGGIAVDIFFVTSGFLVTASLLSRHSARDFIRARVLRIYPALIVATLLTVAVAGPLLTDLTIVAYLQHPETVLHLLRNATLVTGVSHQLPGVFAGNSYPNAVNSSLWSLPYEIGMYVGLLMLWAFSGRKAGGLRLVAVVAAVAVLALAAHYLANAVWRPSALLRLTWMFFAGALLQLNRDRVIVSPAWLALAIAAILAATLHRTAFLVIYTLLLPYVVLSLAYVPAGALRAYNRLGDYSYGVYIYAFPIQQTLALAFPSISVANMVAASGALTIAAGVLSWHLVEQRALSLRNRPSRSVSTIQQVPASVRAD